MMKRKVLEVSLPLLVCLGCLCLVTAAVAGPVLVNVKAAPDLVVKKVTLVSMGSGEFPAVELDVTVKNIGNKESGACNMALCFTSDVYATGVNQPFMVQCGLVPKLQPNASWDVNFNIQLPESRQRGMCVAVVDAPIQGNIYGHVAEWPLLSLSVASYWAGNRKTGEQNNAFGFTYGMKNLPLPFSWRNPAVD